MSKKSLFFYTIFLLTFSSNESFAKKAELYNTIRPVRNLSFSVEPELGIDQYNGDGYSKTAFCFGIGAIHNLDINLLYKIYSDSKPYYGVHLEYHFIKQNPIKFAISTGAHYKNGITVYDLTPVLGHKFNGFSFATGPEMNWALNKNKSFMLDWFFGISAPFAERFEVSVSMGLPIKNESYWISNGWTIYF
jgi:hypothetical protein